MHRAFSVASHRWLRSVLVVVTLVSLVGAVGPPARAAIGWQAQAGADSPDHSIQLELFLSNDLTVNVGDTITWLFPTPEPHTVTFLSGQPAPPNNAPPTPPSGYTGTNLVNSGRLANGQTFSLTFVNAGTFTYVCLLHPRMTGIVRVQPIGTAYPHDQEFYNQQSLQQIGAFLAVGETFKAQGLAQALAAGPGNVTAGIGDGIADVMRFQPDPIIIPVGGTVTWTNRDTSTPHTVTFGQAPANPQAVVGTDSPGHATITPSTQSVSSGFIGARFPNGATFQATFPTAGTYSYICILHAAEGMVGTVQVVASGVTPTPVVPEVSPFWLFGSGVLALGALASRLRRRRRTD